MSYRPKNTQDRILHRLKISKGHLQKIITMVEKDSYCIDVLHQSQAVQKALEETDTLILENHLRTCVVDNIKKGNVDISTKEIIKIFKRGRK